ncbi:MAG: hypothetical protein Q7R78_03140 [bacterium]|nr:hypothetical protein [bacterium]
MFINKVNITKFDIKIVFSTALFFLLLIYPFYASAFSVEKIVSSKVESDFVVGPGKSEFIIKPGESVTAEIIVTNRMGVDKVFNLSTEDFSGTKNISDLPIILLGKERGPYSLKDYVSIKDKTFTLHDDERARVPVTISIPADAEPGGLYGSVLVSMTSDDVKRNLASGTAVGGAVVETRVGSLLFIRIPGNVKEEGLFKDLTIADNRKFFAGGPIKLGLLFENTGSIHLNPFGEIIITNILGQEVGNIKVEPWFVLPDSIRLRDITFEKKSGFMLGPYKVTASINRGYDSVDIVDQRDITFWVIPWKHMIGLVLVIMVLLMSLKFVLSKFEIKRK